MPALRPIVLLGRCSYHRGVMSDERTSGTRAVVWTSPERVETVREIVRGAGVRLVAAGGPDSKNVGQVAADLAAQACSDLRQALTEFDTDLILLASPGDFGAVEDREDAAYALKAHQRGVKVMTLEPVPASALEMTAGRWDSSPLSASETIRFVPIARATRAFGIALDALEHFGAVRSMSVTSVCRSSHGSLGARAFGAIELVQTLMGTPETVDAAAVGPAQPHGFAGQARDSLRGLAGDLSATMRFADGRVASLFCSDQAGAWTRRAILLGEGGRIEVDDGTCRWVRPDGSVEEDFSAGTKPTGPTVIAESVRRLIAADLAPMAPLDESAVLATAQAALLSTRTAQPESPATALRMLGRL